MSVMRNRVMATIVMMVAAAHLSCSGGGSLLGPAASITIQPQHLTAITQGGVVQFEADIRDASGRRLTLGPQWSSSNEAVATITASGQLTARAVGATTITASRDGISAQKDIAVVAPAGASGL